MSELLKGLKILDFTHRLPGPFGAHLLAGLGATVIKIEDQQFKDPFVHGLFPEMDDSFAHWYKELNQRKEVKRLDFKSPTIKEEILSLVNSSDAILLALPESLKEKLGLSANALNKSKRPLAICEMSASFKVKESMHDLNALAHTGLLKLQTAKRDDNIITPPFLPMAGISFGMKSALDLLAAVLKSRQKESVIFHQTALYEVTEETLSPFWPKELRSESQFLHNGKFPCYSIYKLKSNDYLAVAAVEEKFWNKLIEILELKLTPKERFHHQDNSVFETLSRAFLKIDLEQWNEKAQGLDLCVTPI